MMKRMVDLESTVNDIKEWASGLNIAFE